MGRAKGRVGGLGLSIAIVDRVVDVASGARSRDNVTRISQNYRHARHIEVDICARGNKCIMSNGYLSHNDGVCTNPNTIFEGGRTCTWSFAGGTDGDALPDIDVGPQNRLRTDDDSAKVPDIQSWADASGGRNIEAVFESVVMKHGSVVDVGEYPERLLPPGVEGDLAEVVGKAESGFVKVCGQKGAPCCLAAVAVDVGAQGLPKGGYQFSSFFFPSRVSSPLCLH